MSCENCAYHFAGLYTCRRTNQRITEDMEKQGCKHHMEKQTFRNCEQCKHSVWTRKADGTLTGQCVDDKGKKMVEHVGLKYGSACTDWYWKNAEPELTPLQVVRKAQEEFAKRGILYKKNRYEILAELRKIVGVTK